jgi:hypothetical protein
MRKMSLIRINLAQEPEFFDRLRRRLVPAALAKPMAEHALKPRPARAISLPLQSVREALRMRKAMAENG